MILVDSSVWIDHLHAPVDALVKALETGSVFGHPFVIGELACGQLRRREEILALLGALPSAKIATHEEVLEMIDRRELMGRGLGYVDVHLLASVHLTEDAVLWTRDKMLRHVAEKMGVAFDE